MSGRIRVANAPCSWGTLEFEGLGGEQIGYAQMLNELASTGYAGTELGNWGYMPTDPVTLLKELRAYQLSMRGAFVPVALAKASAHEEGNDRAIRTAKLLAATSDPNDPPFIVLADENGKIPARTNNAGRITADLELSSTDWKVFAQGAMQIARAVLETTGLRTVFHHHCAGYIETPAETARFLELTDPELIGLVFDTGHYVYGSGTNETSAQSGLDMFRDRIWYVHFKDCEPSVASEARMRGWDYFEAVGHGVFCELGHGCIDFAAVLDWLHAMNYTGWIVVEQDVLPGMGHPKESAARNRAYLRALGI